MDSLNEQYSYKNYTFECYEAGDGPPLIEKRSRLLAAVVQNQVGVLQDLLDSPEWYNISDPHFTLLEIAIVTKNKEVFDYMLSIPDFPINFVGSNGKTALLVALDARVSGALCVLDQDFACKLIKKRACLDVVSPRGENLLHHALKWSCDRAAILLIEKGIDVNTPNLRGSVPLLAAICMSQGVDEVVPALLIHGAVPSIDLFRHAVSRKDLPFFIQEMLFLYLFDEYSRIKLDLDTMLVLLETKSPLVYKLLEHPFEVHVNIVFARVPVFYILCSMDFDALKIAIEKFGDYIKKALKDKRQLFTFLDTNIFMKNVSYMLETQLRPDVISNIAKIHTFHLFKGFTNEISGSEVAKLYCYLLSYGLNIGEWDCQFVYEAFGYCELFKVFLHMDITMDDENLPRAILPTLVYDVTLDLEKIFEDREREYSKNSVKELFSYFVHPELKKVLPSVYPDENCLEIPEIPLLVELARNVFRKYFIETFQIRNSRKFYTLLNQLPISAVHRKILSYETKLYEGVFCSDSSKFL